MSDVGGTDVTGPASDRVRMRRGANRAVYDPAQIRAILAAGHLAHVGVVAEDGPVVLPMVYGVRDTPDGGELLIHGAVANAMMRAGRGLDICVTVTIVDGLVVARTPLHNSMNYRSVVVRGAAEAIVEPADKLVALQIINDHIAPIWATARPPSEIDVKKTLVMRLPLTEASAKVRGGDPIDEDDDLTGPHWAGVVPLIASWGPPTSAADLRNGPSIPSAITALAGANAHPIT